MPLFDYPSLLRPTSTEELLVNKQALHIPKLELRLRRWTGTPILHTFGNKPLIDFSGRPLFAELCIYELLHLSGWQARWVETFGAPALRPSHFTHWKDAALREQQHDSITDQPITDLLRRIAEANGNSYAGCWDVVGWQGTTILFAELKRYKKDRIRATQPRWLEAALTAGLQPENFLLVEWGFAAE